MLAAIRNWAALPRVSRPERLDAGGLSFDLVRQTLGELEHVNRWLGGYAVLRRFVFPRLESLPRNRAIRVLDLACGSAGVSVELARWAREQRIPIQIVALDFLAPHLQIARETATEYPEIAFVRADAREIPFAAAQFDFVISTLFLHHLDEPELVEALISWSGACRGALVLNDLTRGRMPLALFRIVAPLLARSEITVQDGLISIERAYRPEELQPLLRRADLAGASIHHDRLFHRMTVISEK